MLEQTTGIAIIKTKQGKRDDETRGLHGLADADGGLNFFTAPNGELFAAVPSSRSHAKAHANRPGKRSEISKTRLNVRSKGETISGKRIVEESYT